MNNSRSHSTNTPPKFNFSQPPPGYPSVPATPNTNYPPPSTKDKRYLLSLNNSTSEKGYGSPENPYKNDSRYLYYQGSNMQSPTTKPPSQDPSIYRTMPPPPLPVAVADSPQQQRMFAVPPPPPPTEQYHAQPPPPPPQSQNLSPANMPPPSGGYILSSTVYAFPVQNAASAAAFPVPNAAAASAAAAAQMSPQMPPQIGAGPATAVGTNAAFMTHHHQHHHNQQPASNNNNNNNKYRHQSSYQIGADYRNGNVGGGYSSRSGNTAFNCQLGGGGNRKRNGQECDSDTPKKNSSKKKKKPLSQNMPSKKDWSVEEAKRALDVEREYNKRHKSPSLIIKFPDLELNREIVSKFHPKIESVHFQQPSTPRFCFVTLKDSSCIDEVIREIRKIKFGDGFLTAEPKNNREDELVKGPEDIDPLTLYVGNLAQEVTVDDVHKAYPKHKRIDIGFAKKMKYTRYAFVSFRTVDDAIEAFQSTHSTEMYNKSLIVRFRRLHGTVGLPGDPKPQNPAKKSENNKILPNSDKLDRHSPLDEFGNDYELDSEDSYTRSMENIFSERPNSTNSCVSGMTDWSRVSSSVHVKEEPLDFVDPDLDPDVDVPLFDDAEVDLTNAQVHTPLIEPKTEPVQVKQESQSAPVKIKEEPSDFPSLLSGRPRNSFNFAGAENVGFQF